MYTIQRLSVRKSLCTIVHYVLRLPWLEDTKSQKFEVKKEPRIGWSIVFLKAFPRAMF